MVSKKQLRQKLKIQYQKTDLSVLVSQAIKIVQNDPVFNQAEHILAYAPQFPYEIPFVEKLMQQNMEKNWYFPKIQKSPLVKEGLEGLIFHQVKTYSELKPGTFGVLAPSKFSPIFNPPNSTLDKGSSGNCYKSTILIPGLGFTNQGDRLGRGGGFYDRFLKDFPNLFKLAVIPEFALQKEIPTDPWDQAVHKVLTV